MNFRGLAIGMLLFATPAITAQDVASNWHQWRGPLANGVSATANPPLRWSEQENVQWKVRLAGQGGSVPIVWNDQVFVLTGIDTEKTDPSLPAPEDQPKRPFGITYPNTVFAYVVLCLDRRTGQEVWRRTATEQIPVEGHHGDNDFASASPTTDGKRLYVWFGSAGLYCYDLEGTLLWDRDLGTAKTRLSFGEASSPVVHGDYLIVTRDQEEQSYILVLNAETGTTIWKQKRDEPSCWATPLVVGDAGEEQLITNAHNRVRSYRLDNGELLWECGGQVSNVIPSPVRFRDRVICMSGYQGSSAMALPLNSKGDISDSNSVIWRKDKGTPYVPSPLLYDDLLYYTASNRAILTCLHAETGDELIEQTRLQDLQGMYASPVGAAGRVYLVGRNGVTQVIKKGRTFEVLATNALDERIDASPALAGDQIFLRGEKFLYCIANATP